MGRQIISKNPQFEIALYSDPEGIYRMVDFNDSHSELLFRCRKNGEKEYNIDIRFKGVLSLNASTWYKGLFIYIVARKEGMSVRDLPFLDFVFKLIDTAGMITYIDASAARVYINELDYQKSSLGSLPGAMTINALHGLMINIKQANIQPALVKLYINLSQLS